MLGLEWQVMEHLKPATREVTASNYSFIQERSSYLQFSTVLVWATA